MPDLESGVEAMKYVEPPLSFTDTLEKVGSHELEERTAGSRSQAEITMNAHNGNNLDSWLVGPIDTKRRPGMMRLILLTAAGFSADKRTELKETDWHTATYQERNRWKACPPTT